MTPYTWSLTAASTGPMSGTPTKTGTYSMVIKVESTKISTNAKHSAPGVGHAFTGSVCGSQMREGDFDMPHQTSW